MFFVMGERVDRSAWPVRVTAELYRAHPIQNYDTAMLRAQADNGAEVFFAVSHAVQQARGPVFSYEFENGVVQYSEETSRRVMARFKDGSVKDYGSPDAERIRKLWATMDAIRGGPPVPCSLEAASSQTACMFGAQQSPSDIAPFPASLVHVAGEPGSRKTWVDGLEQVLTRCYDEWRLPSELGVAWASPGREVDTRRYAELVFGL